VSWQAAAWLLLGGTTAILFLGVPVAYSFFAINVIGAWLFFGGDSGLDQLVRNGVVAVASFSLTPIPLFILMGEILFHTGLAQKAIDGIDRVIPRVPGRLAVIAVVAGTFFSAISGSTIATTAMLGSLMLPMMLAKGYDAKLGMGPIIAIGGVDMLIPPSALAVLLGSLAGISISKLLVGGVVPGFLLALLFVAYIVVSVKLNPRLAPEEDVPVHRGWQRWRGFAVYVLPLSLIFVAIVGVISGGVATPTEAAAIGCAATLGIAVAYRALSWGGLAAALRGTVTISGMILFIIVAATTFSQVLSFSGATNGIVEQIRGAGLSPMAVVAIMLGILVFLGLFVDQVSMMLLTLPFYMPIVKSLGIDTVWFGVMYLICMQLGLLMPPHGMLLYTMKGVAPPHITMGQVFASAIPYVTLSFAMLVLIFFVPSIATWLPAILVGR
jgi:tripartite ATP-independent transporter DctM subunit